ncbi:phage baseplate plug family protein [Pseudochelatococcus contaminans]|uniref:Cyanophage baseplate Pam3 plug gp18 domain-containing protein n=1 Tax=Pseudochelatococcus contaminans TaxID=1538103 RepID=A0A7W5Z781_9HYPH|nr:hypothetical protein [Pseudochelatococcus contaminans]MBB3811466.1 hypothetical protein [Pseudochelatococcus contaminans]
MPVFEIPLIAAPQTFIVSLSGVEYRFRLTYADAPEGGWLLDILDNKSNVGTPLVRGIPLVTGADLLAPYRHLGIGGGLIVASDADMDAVPTFQNLGSASKLYFKVADGLTVAAQMLSGRF